jgi:hypothetical protein
MTGYGGYFMGGLASGFQSGMEMGAKYLELKWAKEEKEKAEKANQEMIKALSNLNNSLVNSGYYDSIGLGGKDLNYGNSTEPTPDLKYGFNDTSIIGNDVGASIGKSTLINTSQPPIGNDLQYKSNPTPELQNIGNPVNTMNPNNFGTPKVGSLGVLASPEAMKVIAIAMTLSDTKAAIMSEILLAIDKGDREKSESLIDYYKSLTGYVATMNMNGISVEGTIAGLKNILPEDQLKRINAVEMYSKTPANKVTPGLTSEMAGMSGFSPEIVEGLKNQPAEGHGTPLTAKDNMIIESYKKGAISFNQFLKYMGIEPEKATAKEQEIQYAKQYGATNEEIKNMLVGKASTTTPEDNRVTSLPQLEEYREKALNADTWEDAQKIINDYTNAGYDSTQVGINKDNWVSAKKSDLDNLIAVLNEITAGTPEGQNIKGKKEFTFNINDKDKTLTGEEWYKQIYDSYIALLKLLEEQGVDTSQYKKLKPLSEIKKANFLGGMFTGKGVEKGDLVNIFY